MKMIIFVLVMISISSISWARDMRYNVTAFGNNFQIISPFGSRVYIGDLGLNEMRSYSFEIPIEDLKATHSSSDGGSGKGDNAGPGTNLNDNKSTSAKMVETEEELIFLANQSYNEGKFNKALEYIDETLTRNNKNIRAWTMKGSLMHYQGQSDLAKIYWRKALKLEPDNKQIKSLLGE